MYDFGRPFPAQQVQSVFKPVANLIRSGAPVAFEPGCGTGRVLLPIAEICPSWKLIGLDSSPSSLQVCKTRIQERALSHVHLHEQSLEDELPGAPWDLIIHSSVLHVVPEWREAMERISAGLARDGIFCLIGDYGDIYDEALGRPGRPDNDPLLSRFWRRYIELRKEYGAPDPESAQTGCRWDLESRDLASWLIEHDFEEVGRAETRWTEQFSRSDLLEIIEERCYSSMFTVPEDIYSRIVETIREDAASLEIVRPVQSRHFAVGRYFRRL